MWMNVKSRYALHRILNIPKTLGKKMTCTQIHACKNKINNIPRVLSPREYCCCTYHLYLQLMLSAKNNVSGWQTDGHLYSYFIYIYMDVLTNTVNKFTGGKSICTKALHSGISC
jgi:hypothetical protein